MYRPNRSKSILNKNDPVFGLMHGLSHPRVAEMIGIAGYDFIVIDAEHGPGGMSGLSACLQAAASTPATAIVRVAPKDTALIRKALDLGAEGIMVGDVANEEAAVAAAAACFYPPKGSRGFSAGTVRASDYGLNIEKYLAGDGAELLLCLMIESAEGVKNAHRIASVEGVDVIQLGPFDLSYDLGIPGQFEHPKFLAAIEKIEKGVKKAGKILGGVPLPGLPLEEVLERGYRMITVGADVPMLAAALKGGIPEMKKTKGKGKRQSR